MGSAPAQFHGNTLIHGFPSVGPTSAEHSGLAVAGRLRDALGCARGGAATSRRSVAAAAGRSFFGGGCGARVLADSGHTAGRWPVEMLASRNPFGVRGPWRHAIRSHESMAEFGLSHGGRVYRGCGPYLDR
jgi:hypothetical protein